MKRGSKPKPELSPKIAAIRRLTDDGASSNATIRKRIALIAAERKLDPLETKALMKRRWLTTYHLCQFAKKHHLSASWLIHGELKAHPRGTVAREPASRARPGGKLQKFRQALSGLDDRRLELLFRHFESLADGDPAA
jgi:hypothetical protein